MSAEQPARKIDEILRRLDQLEATAHITYGKGTYTPTYLGGTTAGVTTYAADGQVGYWRRLGDLIFFWGRVQWTAATGTGQARIFLPFTAVNVTNLFSSLSVDTNAVTFANSTPTGVLTPNTNYFFMRSPLTNAAPTDVAVEAAGVVNFAGFFGVT